MEGALLRAAAAAGVPVPAVVALGEGDELGAGWLVVERLEGETIPRRILRDDEWAAARAALTAQAGRALAAIHTIDPASIEGLPRPTRWATPCRCSMRSARSGPRSSSGCAGWPPTARRRDRG